jgi:hypothetical protein
MHPVDMQPSKHEWRSTLAEIIGLLNDRDPDGLAPGTADGAPQDEYETEASPIAGMLLTSGSISRGQVDAIWQNWFQEEPLFIFATNTNEHRRPYTDPHSACSRLVRGA